MRQGHGVAQRLAVGALILATAASSTSAQERSAAPRRDSQGEARTNQLPTQVEPVGEQLRWNRLVDNKEIDYEPGYALRDDYRGFAAFFNAKKTGGSMAPVTAVSFEIDAISQTLSVLIEKDQAGRLKWTVKSGMMTVSPVTCNAHDPAAQNRCLDDGIPSIFNGAVTNLKANWGTGLEDCAGFEIKGCLEVPEEGRCRGEQAATNTPKP